MLEKQRDGAWNAVRAAVGAFALLTSDPNFSLAAAPKERGVLPGGDLKKYFEKNDEAGLKRTIEDIERAKKNTNDQLKQNRNQLIKMMQIRDEAETAIKKWLEDGDESELDEKKRNDIKGLREKIDARMKAMEQQIKELEEDAAELDRVLAKVLEQKRKLEERRQKQK